MKFPEVQLNQKTIITISAIILLIAIVYFVARKAIKAIKSDKYQKNINNEIQPDKLSYPLNQYAVFADKMAEILYPLNTDEDALYSIIKKMNTLSDVLQLNKAYGVRPLALKWDDFSLVKAFMQRLTAAEIEKVNSILKTNNVNFSF
jgi:hypothetical protein